MESEPKYQLGHAELNSSSFEREDGPVSEHWYSLLELNPLLWACLVAIPVHLVALLVFGHPLKAVVSGVGVGLFVALRRHTLIRGLRARASSSSSPLWEIHVDHVTVGKVKDSDLAALRLRILSDVHTYWAQFLNMVCIGMKALWSCVFLLALVVFSLELALLLLAPAQIPHILRALLMVDAFQIQYLVLLLFTTVFTVIAVTLMVAWLCGRSYFGFRNYFGASLTAAICQRCRCSLQGPVDLVRAVGQSFQTNRECSQL